jgi:pyruvate carboxylase
MAAPAALVKAGADASVDVTGDGSELMNVTVEMRRVGPLKAGSMRTVVLAVNGKEQHVEVKDSSGKFEFTGPMADPSQGGQLGSPMPGVVEKLLVTEGKTVTAGETLCTISAMKMEVKVTAPFDGKVGSVSVAVGTRVVEGALLLTIA